MHPISPKASLAISGKDRICFRIRTTGAAPGSCCASKKTFTGRGSPLSSREIKMDVFHVMKANSTDANKPPSQPALLNTKGNPNSPTPCVKEITELRPKSLGNKMTDSQHKFILTIRMFAMLNTHWANVVPFDFGAFPGACSDCCCCCCSNF